jgi:hypothetical protein
MVKNMPWEKVISDILYYSKGKKKGIVRDIKGKEGVNSRGA